MNDGGCCRVPALPPRPCAAIAVSAAVAKNFPQIATISCDASWFPGAMPVLSAANIVTSHGARPADGNGRARSLVDTDGGLRRPPRCVCSSARPGRPTSCSPGSRPTADGRFVRGLPWPSVERRRPVQPTGPPYASRVTEGLRQASDDRQPRRLVKGRVTWQTFQRRAAIFAGARWPSAGLGCGRLCVRTRVVSERLCGRGTGWEYLPPVSVRMHAFLSYASRSRVSRSGR